MSERTKHMYQDALPNCCQADVIGKFPYDSKVKESQAEYKRQLADAKKKFEEDLRDGIVDKGTKFDPEGYFVYEEEFTLDVKADIESECNLDSPGLVLATTRSNDQTEAGKALKQLGFKQLAQFQNRSGVVLILWGKNNRPVEKKKAPKKGTKKASKKARK